MKNAMILILGLGLTAFLTATAGGVNSSGKDLVERLACLGCHSYQGKGGRKGPSWDGLGTRLTPEAIRQQIVSPRRRMPSFAHIRPEELEALVRYLSGFK